MNPSSAPALVFQLKVGVYCLAAVPNYQILVSTNNNLWAYTVQDEHHNCGLSLTSQRRLSLTDTMQLYSTLQRLIMWTTDFCI